MGEKAEMATSQVQDEMLGAMWLPGNVCQFLVWAPRAKGVEVRLSAPRERTIAMEPLARSYFRAVVEDVAPDSLYRYRLDGTKERPDPASRLQPQGVHGPSAVVDTRFPWKDAEWRGLPLEKYVLYEVHVGTFTPEGTLDAAIARIGDLKGLGITAIELMPVAQFPGNRNWGYDGVYPCAVQDAYGGPAAMKRFVAACHREEMAVALDVVYNHLGPEGNYFGDYGPYFTDTYKTPWGEAINFDGPQSDEVRRYFIENALRWITEFHVDALRLDAIHAIMDPSAKPFLEELAAAVQARARRLGRPAHLFAESNRNDSRIVRDAETGGTGLDGLWNDDFHHALHALLTGERSGYYGDFGDIKDLADAWRRGFVYAGRYSRFAQRRVGNSSEDVPAKRFVVFAQNHDQVGNRKAGDRLSQTLSLGQLKLAPATVLLSPYLPLLFMGEEYGETAPFQYFVSHGNAALIDAVRNGRREEFARFEWEGDLPDPQDEQTFLRSKLQWESRGEGRHGVLLSWYRELLRCRREVPALARLDKNAMEVAEIDDYVLFVRRWHGDSCAILVFHFAESEEVVDLPLPAGRWQKALDSEDQRWGGSGRTAADEIISQGKATLTLAGWQFLNFIEKVNASGGRPEPKFKRGRLSE